MGAARQMGNMETHEGKTPNSAEKRSWEGIRRLGLADFGTWREDGGVEHLVSLFPFLPASDYPRLAFLPSEQTPRELTRCRGGGCRAAVDVRVKKVGVSVAGEKGSAFLLIFQELGGVSALKNL